MTHFFRFAVPLLTRLIGQFTTMWYQSDEIDSLLIDKRSKCTAISTDDGSPAMSRSNLAMLNSCFKLN